MKYVVQPMGGNHHCRMEFNSLREAIEAYNNRKNHPTLKWGCEPFSIEIITEEGGVKSYLADDCSVQHYVFSNVKTDIFCYNIAEKNCPDEWVSEAIKNFATERRRIINLESLLFSYFD